ncbi:MAG TPA: hypothetical protein VGJ57_12810 [Nitrospirales bacterium]|jgi:hypothetical protein
MNQENDAMSSLIAFTGSGTLEIAGDYVANAADQPRTRSSTSPAEVKTTLQRGEETPV